MKILVTGGAGYIGSHVLKRLARENCQVIVYDNLSTGFKENVKYGDLIIGDLNDRYRLKRFFLKHKIDLVMHLAASVVVSDSVVNPLKTYINNVGSTMNLLACMQEAGVRKIIFSSTAAVYGSLNPIVNELSPLNPINPYGHSKLMAEQMLDDLQRAGCLDYTVLRYFNAIGAASDGELGDRKKESTHIVSNCFKAAMGQDKAFLIYGSDYDTPDGTCIRDYIHVEDIAEAHVLALRAMMGNERSEVYNCGYGQGFSVKQIVNAVRKITGAEFPIACVGRRTGDIPVLIADSSKIKERLGWKPQHLDLQASLKTAWNWENKKMAERINHGFKKTV